MVSGCATEYIMKRVINLLVFFVNAGKGEYSCSGQIKKHQKISGPDGRGDFLSRNFPGEEALAKLVIKMKNNHKSYKTVKGCAEEKLFASTDWAQGIPE
jgi:hypothetical protein